MPGYRRDSLRLSQFALPLSLLVQACLLLKRLDLLPTWGDEHFTLRAASGSAVQALKLIAGEKNNPPLHTLLVHFWLMIPWPVSKIVAARALSVLFALAATVVMDKLWLKPLSQRARLWFLALWALSPCLLLYARISRSYSLQVLVFVIALRVAVDFLLEPRTRRSAFAFGAGVAVLLYVHYLPGLALLFGVFLILIWRALRQRRPAMLAPAAVVGLVVLVLYAPWLPQLWVALQRMASTHPPAVAASSLLSEPIRLGYLLFSFSLGETPALWVLAAAVLAAPGIAYLAWKGTSPQPAWLPVCLLAAVVGYPAAERWVSFVFTPARLLFLLPFFLLLVVLGAERSPRIGWLVCGGMLCLSVGSLASYFHKQDFLNKAYLLPYDEIAHVISKGSAGAKAALIADSCNTDPAPLADLIPRQVAMVVVSPKSTATSLRRDIAVTGATVVWYFRNTHDTSPGGLNRLMEKELAAGRSVRQYLFVPYSQRDRFFMKALGWQERPAYFVQLLEIRQAESGPGPVRAETRFTSLGGLHLQVVGH